MKSDKDYNSLVNPTYQTAKITSFLLSQTGDENAKKLVETFDIEDPFANSDSNIDMSELFKILMAINIEARYRTVTTNLNDSGLTNHLDIACGYTPRGLDSIENGIDYVGVDIPVVVDELTTNFNDLVEDERPFYIAGDATNYLSIKKAADQLEGELFITSDGLLTYLNRAELEETLKIIRSLLLEHGGEWFTSDETNFSMEAFKVLLSEDPSLKEQLGQVFMHLNTNRDIYVESTKTTEGELVKEFFENRGFKVEEVPYYSDKFPITLLETLPENTKEVLNNLLHQLTAWKLTAIEDNEKQDMPNEEEFQIDYSLDSGTLNISLSGRLDTLSSPELLRVYDENKSDTLDEIIVDMKDLSFISSTGLRVFKMIADELEGRKIKIKNASPSILDTGLSKIVDII